MTVKLTVDMEDAFKKAPWPSAKERKRLNRIMAEEVTEIIKSRVHRGESLEGGTFKRYHPSYEKYKRDIGRSPHSPGDWLRLTTSMMKALQILEYDADHWIVGFAGNHPRERPRTKLARKRQAKKERWDFKVHAAQYYKPGKERREGLKTYRGALRAQKGREQKKLEQVSNAFVAYHVDKLRPFVGLTEKEKAELIEYTLQHWTERL